MHHAKKWRDPARRRGRSRAADDRCGRPARSMTSKYPDLSGQWKRPPGVSNQYDISKTAHRRGSAADTGIPEDLRGQTSRTRPKADKAPTRPTPASQTACRRAMNVIFPMEIVVTPKTTYVMIEYLTMLRRIYTDGRDWPKDAEPSFMGYSIGNWDRCGCKRPVSTRSRSRPAS